MQGLLVSFPEKTKKDLAILDTMKFFNERFVDDEIDGDFSLEWEYKNKRYIMAFSEL